MHVRGNCYRLALFTRALTWHLLMRAWHPYRRNQQTPRGAWIRPVTARAPKAADRACLVLHAAAAAARAALERANGAPDANASTRSTGFVCASSARAAPRRLPACLSGREPETSHRARPVVCPTSDSGDVPTSDRSTPTQRPRPLAVARCCCMLARPEGGSCSSHGDALARRPAGRRHHHRRSHRLAFGSQFYYAIRAQIQPIGTYSTCVRPHVRTSSTLHYSAIGRTKR